MRLFPLLFRDDQELSKTYCIKKSSSGSRGRARGRAPPRAGQKKKKKKKKKRTRLRNWLRSKQLQPGYVPLRQQATENRPWLPGVALLLAQFVSFWRQSCFTSELSVRPFEITFLSLWNTRRYNEEEKAGPAFDFHCLRPFVEALLGRRNRSGTDRESQAIAGSSSSRDRYRVSRVPSSVSPARSSRVRPERSSQTRLACPWWSGGEVIWSGRHFKAFGARPWRSSGQFMPTCAYIWWK